MHTTIVGGGVIGLAVAWRAGQAGHDVTVFDPAPGRAASWAAAGMLAPVTEAHYGEEPLLALNLAASQGWAEFAAELHDAAGVDPGYRRCGAITVARDLDDQAALAELFAFQQRLGLSVERLTGSEVRALEPTLSPRIRGGLSAPDDHQVDNRALLTALLAACRNQGVHIDERAVQALDCSGGAVGAVVTADGDRIAAEAVVIAAGATSGRIAGIPPRVLPPLRPVKGQLLHLRGLPAACPGAGVIRGLEVYIVSRGDGRVVVGATMEERGMDTTVTAGAVMELLRAAWELVPGLAELELVEATAGLRPATADNAPVVGPTEIDGLHLAVGHFRNGILLAPVTADSVVAALEGAMPDVMAPFTPARFVTAEATR